MTWKNKLLTLKLGVATSLLSSRAILIISREQRFAFRHTRRRKSLSKRDLSKVFSFRYSWHFCRQTGAIFYVNGWLVNCANFCQSFHRTECLSPLDFFKETIKAKLACTVVNYNHIKFEQSLLYIQQPI